MNAPCVLRGLANSSTPITQWTKREWNVMWGGDARKGNGPEVSPEMQRCIIIMSVVIWFLERVALRGEVAMDDLGIPLEEQLTIFEEMVLGYIERLLTARENRNLSRGNPPEQLSSL